MIPPRGLLLLAAVAIAALACGYSDPGTGGGPVAGTSVEQASPSPDDNDG